MINIINKFLHKIGYSLTKVYGKGYTRYSNELEFFKTKTGNYFVPKNSDSDIISIAIREGRIYDEEIVNSVMKYSKPNSTILDIGANFGQMSVQFSKLHNGSCDVYSFEANDFIHSILNKNKEANCSDNIYTFCKAVYKNSKETLFFPDHDFNKFSSYGSFGIDYKNNQGRPVETIAIDDLVFEKPVSFMKIDIQGGDLFALKGAINTIKKFQMPIIFEYEYAFEDQQNLCFQDYIDFVNEINYKFYKTVKASNYLIIPR